MEKQTVDRQCAILQDSNTAQAIDWQSAWVVRGVLKHIPGDNFSVRRDFYMCLQCPSYVREMCQDIPETLPINRLDVALNNLLKLDFANQCLG
jgi:hypothetical protein